MKSMYSYQTSRLIKKFWLLFVIVIIFSASVKFAVYRSFNASNNLVYMNKETAEIYNELIENSADKTLEQCDEYITEYEMRSYASGYNNNITAAVNKYKTELRSCFMVESIRSYARTGKGLTDANIPSDLVKNSRLYAAFPTPQVINDEPFLKFLELQAVDIMPIFVLLLVGVFVADSYEKRMDQQIRISKNSSAFFKSREIILSVAIFIMFTLSFFADLIISGTLHQSKYSTSSLQSVWQFDLAPLMLTVRGTIIWLYVTRLMSLFITYGIFVLVAKQVCSVKKYVMLTSGLIAVMSAAAHYVGALSPYMFAAVTSVNGQLNNLDYMRAFDCSEAVAVFIYLAAILSELTAWRYSGYYEKSFDR